MVSSLFYNSEKLREHSVPDLITKENTVAVGIMVSRWLDVIRGPPEIRTTVNGFRQRV